MCICSALYYQFLAFTETLAFISHNDAQAILSCLIKATTKGYLPVNPVFLNLNKVNASFQ